MSNVQEIVAGQLWEVGHVIPMIPGVRLPARMVIMQLEDGLALWSPVPISDSAGVAIDAIGPVRYIIAPNNYHHLFLRPAMERYPDAEVWAAPGLQTKRADLNLTNLLGPGVTPPFAAELEPLFLQGQPMLEESVFLHHATRTAIVTDALFNLEELDGAVGRFFFRMVGAYGKPAQSRMWRAAAKDKAAVADSLRGVLAHDFDRLVMAHGSIIQTGGHRALTDATSWLLG